jgi:hypothetical protein
MIRALGVPAARRCLSVSSHVASQFNDVAPEVAVNRGELFDLIMEHGSYDAAKAHASEDLAKAMGPMGGLHHCHYWNPNMDAAKGPALDALIEKHGDAAAATIAELKAVHAEGSAKWYEYQQWKFQLIFITFLPIYFFGNLRQNFINEEAHGHH